MEFNAVGVEGALGVVGDRNVPPPLTPVSGNAGALSDLGELCESPSSFSSLSVISVVVYFRDATLGAGTEQAGAHPQAGASGGNGWLEVESHTHGQFG